MEYFSSIKKKEILEFSATWRNVEDIMRSRIVIHSKANTV